MIPVYDRIRFIQRLASSRARISAAASVPSATRQRPRLRRTATSPPAFSFRANDVVRCFATTRRDGDDGYHDETMMAQLEEEQHLAKQLSKLSEQSMLRRREWSGVVSNYPPKDWRSMNDPLPGLHHYSSARYEHEGLAEIHSRSYSANVLLEIRDVRVPASSHHPSFTRLARHRTHLICYTHADLIDAPTRDGVERWTAAIWPESKSIFVDTRSEGKSRDELHYFDALYDGLLRTIEERGNNIALTVGVANVGKSSVLMSTLRLGRQRGLIPKNSVWVNARPFDQKKKISKKAKPRKGSLPGTEDRPGKTRAITEYLLREKPKAYFMDVPGITPPAPFFRERPEAWFGYGATNLLPLSKEGTEDAGLHKLFCEYVLHCANRDNIFQYVDTLNLDGPTDNIVDCLVKLSNKWKDRISEEELWLKRCQTFLKLFNTGNFGPLVLDDMRDYSWRPFQFKDEHFARRSGDYEGRGRAPKFDREDKEMGRPRGRAPRGGGRVQRFDGEEGKRGEGRRRDGRRARGYEGDAGGDPPIGNGLVPRHCSTGGRAPTLREKVVGGGRPRSGRVNDASDDDDDWFRNP